MYKLYVFVFEFSVLQPINQHPQKVQAFVTKVYYTWEDSEVYWCESEIGFREIFSSEKSNIVMYWKNYIIGKFFIQVGICNEITPIFERFATSMDTRIRMGDSHQDVYLWIYLAKPGPAAKAWWRSFIFLCFVVSPCLFNIERCATIVLPHQRHRALIESSGTGANHPGIEIRTL